VLLRCAVVLDPDIGRSVQVAILQEALYRHRLNLGGTTDRELLMRNFNATPGECLRRSRPVRKRLRLLDQLIAALRACETVL
jgi:hypothetical protein